MDKNLANFIVTVRSWLFGFESDLSLGAATNLSNEDVSFALAQFDVLKKKSLELYGYDLDALLVEFPRVEKEYNFFASA